MKLSREPVVLISGAVSALLVAAVALGAEFAPETEGTILAGVTAVAGVIASLRVRKPGNVITVATGLLASLWMLATTFGFEIEDGTRLAVQEVVLGLLALLTRQSVSPVEPTDELTDR